MSGSSTEVEGASSELILPSPEKGDVHSIILSLYTQYSLNCHSLAVTCN